MPAIRPAWLPAALAALVAVLAALLAPARAWAAPVPVHGLFEAAFTGASHANPYTDVTASVTFTGPSGTVTVPAFWDGGTRWVVRFSPDAGGTWSYTVSATGDSTLDGQSGSFTCDGAVVLRGGIKLMPGYPYAFSHEDGTPFYFFGDTQWAGFATDASTGVNDASMTHYFDVRAAQGINYVHADITIAGDDGEQPFTNLSGEVLNPAYFQGADGRVQHANTDGITVGIVLAWWGQTLTGYGMTTPYDWNEFPNDAARLRFARYITARYAAYNVAFIVAGEWNEGMSQSHARAIGAQVVADNPYGRPVGIHATSSTEAFADDSWTSFGDYQQIYSALYANILSRRDHNKPVVNSEYAYFLRPGKPNSATLQEFRVATWDILMAGGYVVTGFGSTYLGGMRMDGTFDVDYAPNDPGEAMLAATKAFFATSRWWELHPDDTLLSGTGTNYALVNPGSQYLVYADGASSPVTLSLSTSATNTYEVRRFDPRTGAWTSLPDYTGLGPIDLAVPDTRDWAWSVSAAGAFDGAPTASIAASATTVAPGVSVTFTPVATDPDGTIASYTWHFGSATVSGSGTPGPQSRSFSTEGLQSVWLAVVDNDGNTGASGVIPITVTANAPPVITSASATPDTVVEGATVAFAATATDAEGDPLTFAWDIDSDGTPEYTTASASHTFTTAGNYPVTLTVSDGHTPVTQVVTVDVGVPDTVAPAAPRNLQVR